MVKIERRHNRYRLRYRDTEGRRRSLSFEERKDALIAKALIDGGCRAAAMSRYAEPRQRGGARALPSSNGWRIEAP